MYNRCKDVPNERQHCFHCDNTHVHGESLAIGVLYTDSGGDRGPVAGTQAQDFSNCTHAYDLLVSGFVALARTLTFDG